MPGRQARLGLSALTDCPISRYVCSVSMKSGKEVPLWDAFKGNKDRLPAPRALLLNRSERPYHCLRLLISRLQTDHSNGVFPKTT